MNTNEYNETLHYIRPKSAYQKMKFAEASHQTAYLYGVSGCGKTSFIRNYLGNKPYVYLSASKIEGEINIGIGSQKTIVVVDDLYTLEDSEQDESIKEQIKALIQRKDIWLIFLNRCKVPRWLISTYFNHTFVMIEEGDFYLSLSEIRRYFEAWDISLSEEDCAKVQKVSSGMGIMLKVAALHLVEGEPLDKEHVDKMRVDAWNYLDEHVYEQWKPEIVEFFMQVCIVETFNVRLAEMITGQKNTRTIIDRAQELGNFLIEKSRLDHESIYEVRLSMRRSMMRKMERTYSTEKIYQCYYNAGLYYELEGDTPNALVMYERCRNYERISHLLIENARKDPSNGHYYALRKYYLALPEEMVEENIELMAGMSMLQSLLMNIEESERWYEKLKAYEKREAGSLKKSARSKLLYLDIALPHRGSISLIEILKSAAGLLGSKDISLSEFSVTSNLPSMMNGGKDFCEWSKRDKELASSIGKPIEMVLGKYGKGLINLALAESYFEKGENDYEAFSCANKGKMQAEAGGKLEQCFVGNGILAWLYVLEGNAKDANELMSVFYKKAETLDGAKLLPNIRAFMCRMQMYGGEMAKVTKWMESAPNEELEFYILDRFRYLTKVRGYLIDGKLKKANALLQRLLVYSEIMKRTYIQIEAELLLAIVEYRMKDHKWRETLTHCLEKAESYHFVRVITREGAAVWELLQAEDYRVKSGSFMEQVMEETEKMARCYPSYLKGQTGREDFNEHAIEILKLQAEGMSMAQIAKWTGMTLANIKYHCQQTYRKLGVTGKAAAVIEAKKRNII